MDDAKKSPEDGEEIVVAADTPLPPSPPPTSKPKPHVLIDTTDSYHTAEHKFDIVAVHGIYGPSEKSWANDKESSWLKGLAISQKWETRVIQYSWSPEDLATSLYTRKAISGQALKLLEELAKLREGQDPPLPLAFFAHDIGGIIVKEALVLACQHGNKFESIRCSTGTLMFFGCPHRSTSFQHMETNIARLLLGMKDRRNTIQDARSLTKGIIAVNNSFLQTKMLARATIITNVSKMENIQEQIFDKSTTSFSTPAESIVEVEIPHADLANNPAGDDFYNLNNHVMNRTTSFPWSKNEISPFAGIIESQVAPIYPLKTVYDGTHKFSWLPQNEVFRQWRSNRNTHFLHIHGSLDISEAAEYAFWVLKEDRRNNVWERILYFKFVKHDIRRNSIMALANSFLSQIFSKFQESPAVSSKFEPPEFSNCWTAKDAFVFLDKIRRAMGQRGRVCWVIDGLDQCDESSQWFLAEILSIAERSENFFKVVITSIDNKDIREALSQFPSINLREHEMENQALEKPSDPDLAFMTEVLQDRTQLIYFESEIRNLVSSCRNDSQLCRFLLEWLRDTRFVAMKDMEEEIRNIYPPSPKKISERILKTVREERRPWARTAIMWILRSVRPLTPEELEIALALNEIAEKSMLGLFTHFDIMEELNECFGPLFVLENGEICLAHPSIREIFSPENSTLENHNWYLLDALEENHRKIVDICLRYLALPSVQDQILSACKASSNAQPIFEGQSDLLSYAIQFWPQHYRLGFTNFLDTPVTENIAGFLNDDGEAFQLWSAASWYFSNPLMRSDRSFLSSLPIVASLGMERQVADLVKGQGPDEDKIIEMALTEASRNGHGAVVQTILEARSISRQGYLDAIESAARSVEFEILGALLAHMKAAFNEIQLPSMVISRVAFFGMDVLLETVIDGGMELSPAHSDYPPPLHCAVMRNNISTVDIILDHYTTPNYANESWRSHPLVIVAARYGCATILERLIKAGADIESKDGNERTALWWSIYLGQYRSLQVLLDAGADKSSIVVLSNEKDDRPVFLNSVSSCFLQCVEALLRSGVDPNIPKMASYSMDALGAAAYLGLADMCHLLIKYGAEINGSDGYKPIIHAIESGKREVLDIFIDNGADVDVVVEESILEGNNFACTPLITAAILGFKELAKVILEKDAAVKSAALNRALPNGITALLAAVDTRHTEMIELLLTAGADITATGGKFDWGVLHRAFDKEECMKILLEAGADTESTSKDGTALYLATFHGWAKVVKLLVSHHANLETRCPELDFWDNGYTPLHIASELGHIEILQTLLEGGADINSRIIETGKPNGLTPLMLAVAYNKEESVKTLLDYNPNLEMADNDDDTVIHQMGSEPSLSILKLLVNRGANIERRGMRNSTFLAKVVGGASVDTVKYLIEKKANINAIGGERGGPLHTAANSGDINMLKLLIEEGGDVNLTDPAMGTPLQAALRPYSGIEDEKTRTTVVQYLTGLPDANVNIQGGLTGSALNAASLGDSLDLIALLLEKGADVSLSDDFGRRPIHFASFKTPDHIRMLLDKGADIAAKTKMGLLPLHIAAVTGRVDTVKLVLMKNKDFINEPDDDGWTPLMWACRICGNWGSPSNIEISIIKLLLSHGADLWARGRSSDSEWSPLKLARYYGASDEIIKLLTPKFERRTTSDGKKEAWDENFHKSRRVKRQAGFCDVCFLDAYGTAHRCTECADPFWMCFKCWSRKDDFHPHHNSWQTLEAEYYDEDDKEESKDKDVSPSKIPLVERVEEDDEEGDWSNDDDSKDEKSKNEKVAGGDDEGE